MRAMTGVRTNQPSFLCPSLLPPPPTLCTFPSSYVAQFLPYLVILSLSPSLYPIPPFPLSLFLHPSFPSLSLSSSLLSLSPFPPPSSSHPSLSGITLVDETSPVDEPSDSDQVTEGVKFAYTLPHQQSNQEDSQDDTALVCVHPCACVSACVCTCMCVGLCAHACIFWCVHI